MNDDMAALDESSGREAAQAEGAWTFPPRHILVPVDFGDASARAVAIGAALADRFAGALTVLHADIIEAPAYFTHEQIRALERERAGARAAAERQIRQFVERAAHAPARLLFVEESPSTAIVEAGRAADLIVMGTHGRRGPSRWWMGSVAERVVRESGRPVLVVRAAGSDGTAASVFRRPLIVAAAGQREAQRYGSNLAGAFGGTVATDVVRCEQDLAGDRDATLLVVPGGTALHGGREAPDAKLIRSCTLPMLFLPAALTSKIARLL